MIKKIDVPYYSQYQDVKDEYWKSRSCAIVCIKMIMEYRGVQFINIDDLIREGIEIGGLNENKDWIHKKLVQLFHNYGIDAYRQEFKSSDKKFEEKFLNDGIKKIIENLEKEKPVMVSAIKKWSKKNKYHMVILVGFEKNEKGDLRGFYYNDSDYKDEEGKDLFVDIDIFKKYWRKLAIFN